MEGLQRRSTPARSTKQQYVVSPVHAAVLRGDCNAGQSLRSLRAFCAQATFLQAAQSTAAPTDALLGALVEVRHVASNDSEVRGSHTAHATHVHILWQCSCAQSVDYPLGVPHDGWSHLADRGQRQMRTQLSLMRESKTHTLRRLSTQDGQPKRSTALEPVEQTLVEHAFRRAIVNVSSSAAEAGVPVMRWRREGVDSDGNGALPRLLQLALEVPALDSSEPPWIPGPPCKRAVTCDVCNTHCQVMGSARAVC